MGRPYYPAEMPDDVSLYVDHGYQMNLISLTTVYYFLVQCVGGTGIVMKLKGASGQARVYRTKGGKFAARYPDEPGGAGGRARLEPPPPHRALPLWTTPTACCSRPRRNLKPIRLPASPAGAFSILLLVWCSTTTSGFSPIPTRARVAIASSHARCPRRCMS
mgnify:CR=1 FL=1